MAPKRLGRCTLAGRISIFAIEGINIAAFYLFLDDRLDDIPCGGDIAADNDDLGAEAVREARDAFAEVLGRGLYRGNRFFVAAVGFGDQIGDRGRRRTVLVVHQPVVAGDRGTFRGKGFPTAFSSAGTDLAVWFEAHMAKAAKADLRPDVKLAVDDKARTKAVDH